MIKNIKIFTLLTFMLFVIQPASAKNMCDCGCLFDEFFKENYTHLIEYLNPDCKRREIFDIIFNAYSIKFKAIDYEYKCRCKALADGVNDGCEKQAKKDIKNLTEIAMEEYDSFLDDLTFEICSDEEKEHKFIKKNKKKYRRSLKKLIAKNCR